MKCRERKTSKFNLYHITQRGIAKADIFHDDSDRGHFMNCLAAIVDKDFKVHCHCPMDNHFHLLVQADSIKIMSEKIGRFSSRYAKYYNHKYKRDGPLYKGRYESEAIDTWSYFKNCVRYILRNPIDRGIYPEKYKWSSINSYFSSRHDFVTTALVEKIFGTRAELLSFIKRKDDEMLYLKADPRLRNRSVEKGEADTKRIYKFINSRFNTYNPKLLPFEKRLEIAIIINKTMPDISLYRIAKCVQLHIRTLKKYINKP